jgi:UDPglucose 6-dehydrogenase
LDRRIGPHFLNSGIGFGGFCFPKDLQAFVAMAERSRCDFGLLKKVEAVNQQCVAEFITKVKKELWVLKGKRIGVWGLAFKANTDDMRFSPAAAVVEGLLEEGAEIRAYDPCAMDEARKELPQIEYADSAETAAADCDALVILTEWPEFRKVDLMSLREKMLRPLILDGRNLLDPKALRDLGFEYVSIGRP